MGIKDEIWEAQLREYPDSRRLTGKEVADWVFDKDLTAAQQQTRAYHVAIALPYKDGAWYRTHAEDDPGTGIRPAGGWMGFRYGLDPWEYFSGFTHI